mmetsp:Transcript_51933/g.121752  ORF Transcript_51933/g.121752 Transcript_51933/m.121752 type:complete len:208 (+) Transcript_51933:72-695(+)
MHGHSSREPSRHDVRLMEACRHGRRRCHANGRHRGRHGHTVAGTSVLVELHGSVGGELSELTAGVAGHGRVCGVGARLNVGVGHAVCGMADTVGVSVGTRRRVGDRDGVERMQRRWTRGGGGVRCSVAMHLRIAVHRHMRRKRTGGEAGWFGGGGGCKRPWRYHGLCRDRGRLGLFLKLSLLCSATCRSHRRSTRGVALGLLGGGGG